jgi:predicted phage terminase large subunit-like protein
VEGSKRFDLTLFMGVDPAISISDEADRFAMALLGVSKDHTQVFLLDLYAGRIPFPEQVEKIREWHIKYKPSLIGIEANAYQAALSQQVMRIETLAPVIPMISKGKKFERILSMAPLFKIGKVRIREDQRDFIDEWLDYDSQLKNPKDDCLDAVEIALTTAGALLPEKPHESLFDDMPVPDLNEWAKRDLPGNYRNQDYGFFDEHMGADY